MCLSRWFVPLTFAICAFSPTPATAQSSTLAPQWRAVVLEHLSDDEEKLTALADAIPEEHYNWRPEEGVRSVREVYAHIAWSNFFYAGRIGHRADLTGQNNSKGEMNTTGKTETIAQLRRSFAHMRAAIEKLSDEDLVRKVELWNEQRPISFVLTEWLSHNREHRGQSIAYARTLHVVPPWSRKN